MEIQSNIIATKSELLKLGVNIEKLKEDLTLPNPEYANMLRFGKGHYYRKVDTHICYLKSIGDKYVIPRFYLKDSSFDDKTIIGKPLTSSCNIKLRDYQQSFIERYKDVIDGNEGILIEAPCGHGKTTLSIWLAYVRGVQTMILVPTYYLAKQWKQRIEEYTNAKVVILSPSDSEIPVDDDFTIIVMDLFSCRSLPKELVNNIGHVILDEAHRVGAETYLPILEEIPAKYRTALTATFRRTDGVHRILKFHFGEHIKMDNHFPKPLVYGIRTGVRLEGVLSKNKKHSNFLTFLDSIDYPYYENEKVIAFNPTKELRDKVEFVYRKKSLTKTAYHEIVSCLSKASEMSYSVVESYLNSHSGRRKTAIRIIQKCLDAGRNILFLSKRKDTLKSLYKYFESYRPMLIVSETNNRSSEDEAYLQNACPLIFGVTQLAKEGLDIDRLDTLIIHLPMVDTEQAVGRISRLCDGKKQAMVFYLVDDCPITYSVYSKAKKYFNINGDFKGERTLATLPPLT